MCIEVPDHPIRRRCARLILLCVAPALTGCGVMPALQGALAPDRDAGGRTERIIRLTSIGDAPAADDFADGGAPLCVMTMNMQHRDEPDQIRAMARSLKGRAGRLPDFILCQEVVFDRPGAYADTAAVLAGQLGYFSRGGQRSSDREGVAIVSRYPARHYEQRELAARTAAVLAGFSRVSVMAEYRVPHLGTVRVVNVHLAHWPFEEHIRVRQLRETLQWVARRERAAPADLTILGGDFNASAGAASLAQLSRRGVTGSLRYRDFNSRRSTRGASGFGGRRVDHIFVASPTRDVRMLEEELLWPDGVRGLDGRARFRPSDHLPVVHHYVVGGDRRDRPARFSRASTRTSAPRGHSR